MSRSHLVLLGFFVFTMIPAVAWAQSRDTGTLIVRVEDPDSALLPGVTVVLDGPLGSRTDLSRADGTTRFPGLAPGLYKTTASLDGFKTVVREELRISVGHTTSVGIAMELAAVEETIIVTGESPLVDVRRVNVGALYDDQLIDQAPTASGIWAGVLDHIPGVVLDRVDVGGMDSATQPRFSARGSGWDQNSFTLNGSDTTDPDNLGLSLMFYSTSSFEEVSVSTASHDIEVQVPGVVLNMVSKTGSNQWRGGAKFFWVDESFVSRNVDAELEERGAGEGNRKTLALDLDAQVGGPIIRDHAWFFVDYWNFKNEALIAGFPPDERDEITLRNWTLNGTWQINESHKATIRYFTSRRFDNNTAPSANWLPATQVYENSFVDIPQVQYQGVYGPDTFVDIRFSRTDRDARFEAKDPDSDLPHPDFQIDVPPTYDQGTRVRSGWPELERNSQADRTQFSGNLLHYLTGGRHSHELKIGGEYVETQVFYARRAPFGLQQRFRFGVPSMVILRNTPREALENIHPPNGWTQDGKQYALYAQDSWTIGDRLTINAGVRYDGSRSAAPAQRRLESFWPQLGPGFQAEEIPGRDPTTEWSDLVVRVGLIYDLFGDGRTALKGNYARYSFQQGATWPGYINPNSTGSEYHWWNDLNEDGVFQFGEQAGLYYRSLFTNSMWDVDADLESPITQEVTVGFERELADNLLLSAQFIHRDTDDKVDDINIGVPYGPQATTMGVPDSYAPLPVTDPGPDGVLGTSDDGGPLTLYLQDPATFGDDFGLITNPRKYGFTVFEEYNGLSLVFRKRWSDNWQLLASWDIGRAESSTSTGYNGTTNAYDTPNEDFNRPGRTVWDRTHIVKATGTYLFPEPIGVNLGAFLRVHSGQPLLRWVEFYGYEGLRYGYEYLRAAPPGEDSIGGERYDTLAILDLRAEKQFSLGRWGRLHVVADLFNVFNCNAVTRQETLSGPYWGNVYDLVPPRVFRIGFAWDY